MKQKLLAQKMVCALAAVLLFSGCGKKNRSEFSFDYLAVQMTKGDSWSIIDKNGKEVVKEEYPEDACLSLIYDGVYWVKSNGKYQLYSVDSPKKPLSDAEYTRATSFHAGVAAVSIPNQPIRIADTKGNTITLSKDIKRCYAFTEDGYAVFLNKDNMKGVLDVKGNIVIKAVYEELETPSDGLVLAMKKRDDKTCIILDMKGNKQGEINFDKYRILNKGFSEGKIIVRNANDEKSHLIVLDKTGKKLFEIKKAVGRYGSQSYIDGYLVFEHDGGKFGVVNDKGEVVIRAKYEDMANYGDGVFAAKKGKKWGIINEKDETIIDFDYDDLGGMLGDNYIMVDGQSFSIVGKDNREVTSCDVIDFAFSQYAEYIDIEGLTNSLTELFESFEQKQTASKAAEEYALSIDDYHYQRYISRPINIDGKITGNFNLWFENNLAEEIIHQEQVNDGWFTYTRTVSDGWQWSSAIISSINGELTIDETVSAADLYQALCRQLASGRKKIGEGIYSKNVKINGKTLECRTTLATSDNQISFEMSFNQ